MRAGLVRTFVQVPEVERVTLLIDGDPLKDSKGREIGTMTADSFLENSGREIYQYQYATLTLYFANEAGDHLVKETRRVPYSTNIPLERVVVEQLMKGPKEDGHYAVLPDTMNVLSVTTSDRIAYVNLTNLLRILRFRVWRSRFRFTRWWIPSRRTVRWIRCSFPSTERAM